MVSSTVCLHPRARLVVLERTEGLRDRGDGLVVAHLVALDREVRELLLTRAARGGRLVLITFARHGQGSAAAAADYLLADRDHAGKKRAEVTQLRGDARLVAEVADSLDFEHR